ncbi:MAG TPA: bifunctional demethylmenaquinone methyltransferase/2-methoxy-6-polyprenyl-1,4-benzoquinol methylase UbiE [Vicinamibacterales bacterium]|nr:bifunctional demethylmenaquinone methyltransferase/2-methoxy-6-polyprenyl-1,4-benzoquinol methylase UbiE [Vicinamibacterales bacterium]
MTVSTSRAPDRIAGMFDAIARRYDTLNHLLTAGIDRRWRRRAIRELAFSGRESVLDVCTGTGDMAIEAVTSGHGAAREAVGIDFAGEMLHYAQRKVRRDALDAKVRLVRGDATSLPVPDGRFDAATVGFGIRNVVNMPRALAEFHRALRPGGQLAILEFGAPELPIIRTCYRWYFTYVLPRIGRGISKHSEAYDYLPASVETFPKPPAFVTLLQAAGFKDVRAVPLSFGIVYLYVAVKRG